MGCDKADIPDSPLQNNEVKKSKMKIPVLKKIRTKIKKFSKKLPWNKKASQKDASIHEKDGKSTDTKMVVSKAHDDNALPSADVVICAKEKLEAIQSKTEKEPKVNSAKLSTFPTSESTLSTATEIIPNKSDDTLSKQPNDTDIVKRGSMVNSSTNVENITAPEGETMNVSADHAFAVTGTTNLRHENYGTTSTTEEAPSTTEEAPSTTEEAPSTTEEAPSTTEEAPISRTPHASHITDISSTCTSNDETFSSKSKLEQTEDLETATNKTFNKVQSPTAAVSTTGMRNVKCYNKSKPIAAEKKTQTLPNKHEESGIVLELKISRAAKEDLEQDTKIKVVIKDNTTQSSLSESDVSCLEERVDNQVPQRVSQTSSQDCNNPEGFIYKTPDLTTLIKQSTKKCIKRFSSWCWRKIKISSSEKLPREGQTMMRSERKTTNCEKKACSKMTRCDTLRKGNTLMKCRQKSTDQENDSCNTNQGQRKKETKEACKRENKRKKRTFSRIKDWFHKIWKRIKGFPDPTKIKERCNSMADFHKVNDDVADWDELQPLFEYDVNKSIGCLEICSVYSDSHGTAFRVGNGRLVMTAYHVVKDVIESAVEEIANRIIYLSDDNGVIIGKISKALGVKHNHGTTHAAEETLKTVLWTYLKSSESEINITDLLRILRTVLDEEICNTIQKLLNTAIWTDACTISFEKIETKFSFLYDIPFVDEINDVIILKVAGTNKLPKPLVLDASDPKGYVTMLGYPDEKRLQVDFDCPIFSKEELGSKIEKAVNWWRDEHHDQERCFIEDDYKNMTDKTIIHTSKSFEYGASGGPGAKVDRRFKYPTVNMMYQGGFPKIVYQSFKYEEVPENVKFEACLSMKQVSGLLMKAGKTSLKKEIFDEVQL